MKRFVTVKKLMCILLTASLLLSLCSCNNAPDKKADAGAVKEPGTKQKAAAQPQNDELKESIEKQEVVFSEEIDFNKDDTKANSGFSLGNATLTLDEGKKATVEYKPMGKAVFMELKDGKGNVWRLDIPENALLYSETISMQLTSDVNSDIFSGKIGAGIIFEPEGLQFISPAKLTVTGPAATAKTCVLFGSKDGKHLNLTSNEVKGNTLTTEILHFSSYLIYTPTTDPLIEEAANKAEGAYKDILKEVKAFLKTPISVPPIPPDYDFICKEEEGELASFIRNKILNLYTKYVISPENDLISKLLGAYGEAEKLGREGDGFYYAGLLQKRNLKKINKLYSAYKNDNNKLIPVMNVTFKVLRDASLLGLDEPIGPYLESFSDWMARAADDLIKKIREEHDYKRLGPVLALIQGSVIMNQDLQLSTEFTQKYLQKLKDAMTFTVKYDVSVFLELGNQRMKLSGEAELSPDIENQKNYTTEGKGKYLSYTHSGPGKTTIDFPNAYPVTIKFVDFTPCKIKKLKVQVDKIGAETEVWYNPEIDEKSSDEYNFVNFLADNLLKDYKVEAGGYVFELPFQNKSAVMGPKNFTKTDTVMLDEDGSSTASITYNLEVKHTPK